MLTRLLLTTTLLCSSMTNAFATCIYKSESTVSTFPVVLNLPINNPIIIRADAPANAIVPLISAGNEIKSNKETGKITLFCDAPTPYGNDSSLVALPSGDLSAKYKTKIDGLAITGFMEIDGAGRGSIPGRQNRLTPEKDSQGKPVGRLDTSGFAISIQLYKTKEHLDLKDPNGDVLIEPTPKAFYRWYNSTSEPIYYVNLPEIRVISTPVCNVTDPGDIDFNNVSKANLAVGVTRNIPFGLNCITDYGDYSATASIHSTNATSDGDFIKVTDKAGNNDRMQIKITDSNNNLMKLDGSTSDKISTNVSSGTTANFKWKATLLSVAGSSAPELGEFTANAEIVIQVN